MNPPDEIEEENGENAQDETKEIDSSEDLIKCKTNEFNVEGNVAQTQAFIQNLSTLNINYVQGSEPGIPRLPKEKCYNLLKKDECIRFVEEYGEGECLSVAVILSTFEAVELGNLRDLMLSLEKCIAAAGKESEQEEKIRQRQQKTLISIDTILTTIGGERFFTVDGQECIGFGKNSKQVLLNIWEQFPMLRGTIVEWLLQMNETNIFRSPFEIYQITTAFERVISLDIVDAQKKIFPRLYDNSGNIGLLGALAYRLYELYEKQMRQNEVENIIVQWLRTDVSWLWKSVSLAYCFLVKNDYAVSFETELKTVIRRRLLGLKSDDITFIGSLLFESERFRTMFCSVFHEIYVKAASNEKRNSIAQVYINLVKKSYYIISSEHIELPLVACDTKEQQEYLTPLISKVMSSYRLRRQLYVILEAYLKELSNYHFDKKVINHISAFFYNMALSDDDYRQDIFDFLKNHPNNVTKQIFQCLFSR